MHIDSLLKSASIHFLIPTPFVHQTLSQVANNKIKVVPGSFLQLAALEVGAGVTGGCSMCGWGEGYQSLLSHRVTYVSCGSIALWCRAVLSGGCANKLLSS